MNSPITGKPMRIAYEWRQVPFRKDQFEVPYQFYLCPDTGEQFTTTALDELNLRMVHNQYRAKNHIPQPEEITATREQYGVSATRMGEILGFGPNTYGQYEKGDLPTMANAKLLKMATDPNRFIELASDWQTNAEKAKTDLLNRIRQHAEKQNSTYVDFERYLMGSKTTDQFTGYKSPDYARLSEMVVFFAQEVPCYKTKMNKLLFYADFFMFKKHGQSISGARYKAIPYGPVPNSFESIFEHLAQQGLIGIRYEELKEGGQKQFLEGITDRKCNTALFTAQELAVLEAVRQRFKTVKPYEIVEISHQEKGWSINEKARSYISYHYALDLKAI